MKKPPVAVPSGLVLPIPPELAEALGRYAEKAQAVVDALRVLNEAAEMVRGDLARVRRRRPRRRRK